MVASRVVDWGTKAKQLGAFAWSNVDALLVIVVAVAALLMEVVGSPGRALIDSVVLALLGTTALVLLRDRHGRHRIEEIASFIDELQSDRPYEVQSETNCWEIEQGGKVATFTKTQVLRFTRKVCTLDHWSIGTGIVESCEADWRQREHEDWTSAPAIHSFEIDQGQRYIFSLDTEQSSERGDGWHYVEQQIDARSASEAKIEWTW